MPNWCQNELYMFGKYEELEKVKEFIGLRRKVPEFDFRAIVPEPAVLASWNKDFKDLSDAEYCAKYGVAKGVLPPGCVWRNTNWGTKSAGGRDVLADANQIGFRTAYTPPVPVVKRLSHLFPEVSFCLVYHEAGFQFCGVLHARAGLTIESNGDYVWDDPEGQDESEGETSERKPQTNLVD